MSAKERGLDRFFAGSFMNICVKYDNLAEMDKVAAVSKKMETVKLTLPENVNLALQNCVKLESIEKAAGMSLLNELYVCNGCVSVNPYCASCYLSRGAAATGGSVQEKRESIESKHVVVEYHSNVDI